MPRRLSLGHLLRKSQPPRASCTEIVPNIAILKTLVTRNSDCKGRAGPCEQPWQTVAQGRAQQKSLLASGTNPLVALRILLGHPATIVAPTEYQFLYIFFGVICCEAVTPGFKGIFLPDRD